MVPIPKKWDSTKVNNLCPITLLPVPGKIFEKSIHKYVYFYLENGNLICDQQGVLGKWETRVCLELVKFCTWRFNSNSCNTFGVFVDFAMAFDSMGRNILINININVNAALTIYKAKILSYIDYAILFYNSFNMQTKNKLQTRENSAIRILLKLPSRTNVDAHHIKLNIWHIPNRHRYFLLMFMHTQANLLNNPAIDRRPLTTRAHAGIPFLLLHQCKSLYMKSFIIVGRSLWNELPPET